MSMSNYNELAKKMDGLMEYHAVHRIQRMEVNSDEQAHVDQAERTMSIKRHVDQDNPKKSDFVVERSEKHESKTFDLKKKQKWLKKL